MSKYRQIKFQTLPRQIAQIQDRLDELIMGGTGVAFGGLTGANAISEDLADVSPNLVANAGFENWTDDEIPLAVSWLSAEKSAWDSGTNYAREDATVYSLPYSVKLGDGANAGRGIAQESAFRVVPLELYYLSVRLLGGDADVEYIVVLKAIEADGETEITEGTPLGDNWTYSAEYGGWYISDVAGDEWIRITAPITLSEDVCWLRGSIQYYQNGAAQYLYADDFAITRGSQLPAFSYKYLTDMPIADLHDLLSPTHPDTLEDDVLAGDIIIGNSTPKWARLEKGEDGEVLKLVLGLPSWQPPEGGVAHKLLSATHTDSLPDSVVAGDLIYGNVTPAWARLEKGAAPNGYILGLVSGFPAWQLHTPTGFGASGYVTQWTGVNTVSTCPWIYNDGSSLRLFLAPLKEIKIENLAALPAWGNSGRLVFRTTDNTLYWDSGSGWVPASPNSALLSGYHYDTVPASPVAGDMIVANAASPSKWTRLPKGSSGQLLQIQTNSPTWGLKPTTGSILYGVSEDLWAVLGPGAATYVLTMYQGGPYWRPSLAMVAHPLLGSTWHTDARDFAPSVGAIIFGDATKWTKLVPTPIPPDVNTDGYVLTLSGGYPFWTHLPPHPLLGTPAHSDVINLGPSIGAIIYGTATKWTKLVPTVIPPDLTTDGYVLTLTGGYPFWLKPASGLMVTHPLLGSTWHSDVVNFGPTPGAIIYADTTKWTKLVPIVPGQNGYVLTLIGGYPAWMPGPTGGMTAHSLLGGQWHTDVSNEAFSPGALIMGSIGCWVKLPAGADTFILQMYNNYPTWRPPIGGGTVKGAGTIGFLPVWSSGDTLGDSGLKQDPAGTWPGYRVLNGFWQNTILIANNTPIGWMSSGGSPRAAGINYIGGNKLVLWNEQNNGLIIFATGYGGSPELAMLDTTKFKLTYNQPLKLSTGSYGSETESGFCSVYAKGNGLFYRVHGAAEVGPLIAAGGAGGMIAHPLLGSTWHTDVLNAPSDTGAMIYGVGSQWQRLLAGPATWVLTMYGGLPTWQAPSGGFVKGQAWVNFSNVPGFVDVSTGLASVTGCVCTLHHVMGDGVAVTNARNVPSPGKVRIYGRNVTGSGSLGLDVWWIAW